MHSRRWLLGAAAAAAPTLAIPAFAPRAQEPDPAFALIAEWRAQAKLLNEAIADVRDEDAARYSALTNRLYRALPSTLAGLAALTAIFREEAEYNDDAELWLDAIGVALRKLQEAADA